MIYPSIYLIASNLIFWIIIYLCFQSALNKPYTVPKNNQILGLFFIIIYILFSFWGDWFHYNKQVVLLRNGGGYGFEEVYNWIIYNLSVHYIVFRVIIWGTAFILFYQTAKRLHLNINLVLLFLGCGWMPLFAYARVTLAMSMIFYGYSLIYIPKSHTIINRIIGIGLVLCSFFFHKTALFGILMLFLGIIASKFNKKILALILILTPLLIGIMRNYLEIFMTSGSSEFGSGLEMSVTAGHRYLQYDSEETGIGSLIRYIFEYSADYLMAFLCILVLLSKKAKHMKKSMKTLSIMCLLTIICASIFAFDLGFNTKVLYIRFLRYSLIPEILLMAYFYQLSFHKKMVKTVFILTCCMTIYSTLYTIYLCNVGVDLVGD